MSQYQYKVIPAPTRGIRGKGVKGPDGKFANALETLMNDMGAQGWEFQRAETLPSEERAGLTSKTTVFRNILVFRKEITDAADAFDPKLIAAPVPAPVPVPDAEPQPEPTPEPEPETIPVFERRIEPTLETPVASEPEPAPDAAPAHGTELQDDTPEENAADLTDALRSRAEQLSNKDT
jgi:hypothetical protein